MYSAILYLVYAHALPEVNDLAFQIAQEEFVVSAYKTNKVSYEVSLLGGASWCSREDAYAKLEKQPNNTGRMVQGLFSRDLEISWRCNKLLTNKLYCLHCFGKGEIRVIGKYVPETATTETCMHCIGLGNIWKALIWNYTYKDISDLPAPWKN